MARGDVISDYQTSVANNANLSIQPASGDEWLVVHTLMNGAYQLRSHTAAESWRPGLTGGTTTVGSVQGSEVGWAYPHKFLLTNSEYIRVLNESGATKEIGFSGIKIKE